MKKYRLILSATVLTALLLVSALPVSAFQDVPRNQWYSEGVDYITEKRYMNGVGRDMFAPQALVTRGMLVTVLYRISGMPEPGPESGFMDVEPGSYYEPAAAWAAANGIVTGCSPDVFGPNDAVTREQFATILYRHADYSGLDPVSSGELDAYADRGEISSFAVPAAKWAIGNGVITGTGPAAFSPKGTTTRAQMAVMLMRYLNMGATPSDTPSEALAGGKTPQGGTEPSSQEDGPGGEVSAMPTITVEPVWTAPGAMAVVELRIEHNPGILGMALSISYPEDGLTLARVENGDAFQNILSFTPPKNLKSGCSFVWYGTDLEAGQIQDGCVLRLTFAVDEYAAGEYPIEIWTAASDIIDQSLQPVKVLVRGGAISVQ